MALTANKEVNRYVDQEIREYLVEANVKIYKGAILGLSASGHAQPVVAVDNKFIGIAYESSDNTGGADGAKKVRAYVAGDFEYAIASLTVANLRAPVYASADDTLTLTSTSNTYVGILVGVPSAGVGIVRLDVGRTAP